MKTRLEGNRLMFRDQPFGFWLFYSFFVAGGSVALILSLTAAPEATTTLIGSGTVLTLAASPFIALLGV